MANKKRLSQIDVTKQFFRDRPNQDIGHEESKRGLEEIWLALTGKRFEDSDRGIRKLAQEGFLVKIAKGVDRYEPDHEGKLVLDEFNEQEKAEILKRDRYRCVVCGKGAAEGAALQVDHVKPRQVGGEGTVENGQTLCSQHNFIKKTLKQTDFAKRLFLTYRQKLRIEVDRGSEESIPLLEFCDEILEVFDRHKIDEQHQS